MQQTKIVCDPGKMLFSIAQSLHERRATTFEELKERCAPLGIVNRSRQIIVECKEDSPLPLFNFKGVEVWEKRGDTLVISLEAPVKSGDPVVVATTKCGITFGNLFMNPPSKDILVIGGFPFPGSFIVVGKIVRVIRQFE